MQKPQLDNTLPEGFFVSHSISTLYFPNVHNFVNVVNVDFPNVHKFVNVDVDVHTKCTNQFCVYNLRSHVVHKLFCIERRYIFTLNKIVNVDFKHKTDL